METTPDPYAWVTNVGHRDAVSYYQAFDMWPWQQKEIPPSYGMTATKSDVIRWLKYQGVHADHAEKAFAVWEQAYYAAGTNLHDP